MQFSDSTHAVLCIDDPPAPFPSERWSSDLFSRASSSMMPALSPCPSDASATTAFWSSPASSHSMLLQLEDVASLPDSPRADSPASQPDAGYTRLLSRLQRQSGSRRTSSTFSAPHLHAGRDADAGGACDSSSASPGRLERHASLVSLATSRRQRGAIRYHELLQRSCSAPSGGRRHADDLVHVRTSRYFISVSPATDHGQQALVASA